MNVLKLNQTLLNLSDINYRGILRFQIVMDIIKKFIWIGRFDGTYLDGYSIHISNSKDGFIQMKLQEDIVTFGFNFVVKYNSIIDCIDSIKRLCEYGVDLLDCK